MSKSAILNKLEIRNAVKILKNGGVIVFPTETSYAIGCDATNARAVRRVFAIKGRGAGKGTPLLVDSLQTAERWGVFSSTAKKLAKKYWPGPLTMVVPVRGRKIAKSVLQDGTVALRVSSNPVARALARGLGRPLVATSANLSGRPPCYSIRAFLSQIQHSTPDPIRREGVVVVNVGALPRRKPTTLVRVVGDQIEILRPGSVYVSK